MVTMKIGSEVFEVIDPKKAPKKWQGLVDRASHYEAKYLNQIYDRYSSRKEAIYDYWKNFCYENNGNRSTWGYSAYAIVSHNCNFFSVSFAIDNGEIEATALITPAHNYLLLNR